MRRSSHINQRVQCKECPLSYCITCQPEGCKCGSKVYLYDHDGHTYDDTGMLQGDDEWREITTAPLSREVFNRDEARGLIQTTEPTPGRRATRSLEEAQNTMVWQNGYSNALIPRGSVAMNVNQLVDQSGRPYETSGGAGGWVGSIGDGQEVASDTINPPVTGDTAPLISIEHPRSAPVLTQETLETAIRTLRNHRIGS